MATQIVKDFGDVARLAGNACESLPGGPYLRMSTATLSVAKAIRSAAHELRPNQKVDQLLGLLER